MCAGVWHNIMLFIAAWIFITCGALDLSFNLVGWKHLTDGLSVVDVSPISPLFDHFVPGNIITKVDDTPLNGNSLDVWSKTLLTNNTPESEKSIKDDDLGFCVPNTLLFVQPSDCCLFTPQMPFGHSKDTSLSCFTPLADQSAPISNNEADERVLAKDGQCLSSFDILAQPNPIRCAASKQTCSKTSTCYRPFTVYRTGSMVRLYYKSPVWMKKMESNERKEKDSQSAVLGEQVVLYQGDPKDVWEAIQVTTMTSRWSFLPLWLPNAILLTIRYTMSFSLALSVLNIVPARHLDGHHALKSLLALIVSMKQSYKATSSIRDTFTECILDSGSASALASSSTTSSSFTKGYRVVKGIVISTTVLLGWVMVGSLVQMTATFIAK
ncbi:hypothetical protein BGZ76_003976 [Entomortierella beljakovae]|nr:hypothetical protein BGZ76_003976 [Entomortierella beljakovae]